jgi:hypothetical protein
MMHLLVIPKHKQTTHILSNAFDLHVFPFFVLICADRLTRSSEYPA